jgi:hypothetical protein
MHGFLQGIRDAAALGAGHRGGDCFLAAKERLKSEEILKFHPCGANIFSGPIWRFIPKFVLEIASRT